MVVHKRKKVEKFRAKTTHGYGSMKKNRGAGNRGGRGMAGSGKRADQKKPKILKEFGTSYFGKKGFKRPGSFTNNIINVGDIKKYVEKDLVLKEGDSFVFNATKLGFDKVLGKGKVESKFKVISPSVSESAKKKIEAAGGEVIGVTPS
ncbi:uL15 family ribosomal protein [Candidatus Woesearchaeota archaeon]|nr:uL15 family ribosomal protein [Candidatus Woesearchaeota archaeon]